MPTIWARRRIVTACAPSETISALAASRSCSRRFSGDRRVRGDLGGTSVTPKDVAATPSRAKLAGGRGALIKLDHIAVGVFDDVCAISDLVSRTAIGLDPLGQGATVG